MNYATREVTSQLLSAAVQGDPEVMRAVATAAKDYAALPDVCQQLAAVAAGVMTQLAAVTGHEVDEVLHTALTLLEADG